MAEEEVSKLGNAEGMRGNDREQLGTRFQVREPEKSMLELRVS